MSRLRLQARTLARRIEALSLRERVILFVSAVALLGGVADTLVLSPQFALHKAAAQRMHRQNQELGALRERVARAAAPASADDSPRGRVLAALLRVREEQAELVRQLDALTPAAGAEGQPAASAQPDLPQLLERVLRRHERLTLLQLATVDGGTRKSGAAAAPGAAPAPPARALELKLQGQYADLLQYLAEIERSVPGQRWSTWQLAARDQVPVLTLRLPLAADPR